MKSGFKSSEFWMTLLANVVAYTTDATQGTAAGPWVTLGSTAVYTAMRSWIKK